MKEYNIRFIAGLDCLINSIYVYLEGIERDSTMLFSQIWDFVYEDNPDTNPDQLVGENIKTDCDYEKYYALLKQYSGIKFSILYETDIDKTLSFLNENFQAERPVAFILDTCWCPWHEDYQKMHHIHVCLMLGIEDNEIICMDPIVIPRLGHLKLDDFENGTLGMYIAVEVMDACETPDYKKVLQESIDYIDTHNRFKNMEKFIKDYAEKFDIEKEFAPAEKSLYDVKIYTHLRQTAGCSFLYAQFLATLGQNLQLEKLTELSKDLNSIYEQWELVIGQLSAYYHREYTQEAHQKMIHKFEELYCREKNLYSELKKVSL